MVNQESTGTVDVETDDDTEEQHFETSALTTDNVGDLSVELDIEGLIAELEGDGVHPTMSRESARRRLEQIFEERRIAREMEALDDFDDLDI